MKFVVNIDADALVDWEEVKAKNERKATLNAIDKLRELGPRLVPPHTKALKAETDLFELRPKHGRSKTRPIYAREGEGYVVLAFAADHLTDGDAAMARARQRLQGRKKGGKP